MVPDDDSWCTLTCINKSMHRHKRRLFTKGISEDAIREFEPAMRKHLDCFCGKLGEGANPNGEGWTGPKNMNDFSRSHP